jgi:hypothetical protein
MSDGSQGISEAARLSSMQAAGSGGGRVLFLTDTPGINLFQGCSILGMTIGGSPIASFANGGAFNPKGMGMLQKFVANCHEGFKQCAAGASAFQAAIAAAPQTPITYGGSDFRGSGLDRSTGGVSSGIDLT